jgi:hypothetical protein
MAGRLFSFALLCPALGLTIAAWAMWRFRESSANVQTSKWRKLVTLVGLVALSADAVLSAGYLFFAYSDYLVKFSTFDTCSSVGAAFCLIGIVAAFMGKGMAVRVLILFGCFAGMLFWYLTIGPHT